MIVELAVDNSAIKALEDENKRLHLKLEEAERTSPIRKVEIIDNRTKSNDVKFGGF